MQVRSSDTSVPRTRTTTVSTSGHHAGPNGLVGQPLVRKVDTAGADINGRSADGGRVGALHFDAQLGKARPAMPMKTKLPSKPAGLIAHKHPMEQLTPRAIDTLVPKR